MGRILVSLLLLAGGAVAFLWTGATADSVTRIRITGSSTVAPFITELARRFETAHPEVRIDVESGGSSRGLADARTGRADIGMVSRSLTGSETDLVAHSVARDGIAIVRNSAGALAGLTSEEVRAIFTGQLTDLSSRGGPAGPITVVHKADGRSTQQVFLERFGLESSAVEADVIVGENQHVIRTVANDVRAIGYVSIGAAQVAIERGVDVALVTVDGVEPTLEIVAEGRYPWARTLSLVTASPPEGWAERFIEYVRSPEAAEVIRELQFVPLAP